MLIPLLLLILKISPATAEADYKVGFNQAWIYNRYGSQWVDGFDLKEFKKNIELTRNAGGNILRLWLFEGQESQSFLWKDGRPTGLNPKFVENLRAVIREAKKAGIQLNLTLFDGNMGANKAPSQQIKDYWWNFLNDKYSEREKFINNVYLPLLKILSEGESAGVVSQLDLANEINALTLKKREIRFENQWTGANKMVCDFYRAKKDSGLGKEIAYTASVGWSGAAEEILQGHPRPDCVDFFDIHVYNNGGDIPRCKELANYAHSRSKKIQLGEFGQDLGFKIDWLQRLVTKNFLASAKECGFDGAMAWRLSEPDGSAYLTYEFNGRLRPAYTEFQKAACQP